MSVRLTRRDAGQSTQRTAVTLLRTCALALVATFGIVHAAHALGYVANWLTGWMAFDRDVLTALGLSDDEKIAGFIHIGHSARPADDRPRPALGDIVTRF